MIIPVLFAALFCGWTGADAPAMPLVRVGQGVRPAAMGEAFIGLADDPSAIFWNPAGLGGMRNSRVALSHHEWYAGTRDEVAHVAIPCGPGGFGLAMLYSGQQGIERWSEQNEPLEDFSTWDAVGAFGYGARLGRGFGVGLAAKGVFQSLYDQVGYGGALELGATARPLSRFGFGLAARNFGAVSYPRGWVKLPAEVGVGASCRLPRFVATADVVYPLDGDFEGRLGFEYVPVKVLALRLGYRTGPVDLSTLGALAGLTAGLGVTLGDFGLDYCFAPCGNLGVVHRVGVGLRLRGKRDGRLHVTVYDRRTLARLRASVELSGATDLATGTGRLGELRLSGLGRGRLVIRTSCEGYAPRADTMEIVGVQEQEAALALSPLELGDLWVVLYDAETGNPTGGLVTYQGPVYGEREVDPRLGSFALRSIPAGTYVLEARGTGEAYFPQACTLDVENGRVVEKRFYLARRGEQ